MRTVLTRILLFLSCVATLGQCTTDKRSLIAPSTAFAEKLAADTSFVRIVAITHDFQAVVYNKLRDAHSQQVRKKANEDISRLLACNQQDSLLRAIKMLGFADTRAYLISLDKIQAAARQLRARGFVLDKLPFNAVVQAY